MDGHIFTTHGWLPAAEVDMRPSVVTDDDDKRITRIDKHLRATGEWVGNDLHMDVKRPLQIDTDTHLFV